MVAQQPHELLELVQFQISILKKLCFNKIIKYCYFHILIKFNYSNLRVNEVAGKQE